MARLRYGGSSGDFVINVNNGRPMAYHVVTVHTERTGGTQVTDLLDINSNPVTSVTADGYGLIAFYGPDGTHDTLWLDTGTGSRLACIAMEYAPTGAFAQTNLANTFTFDQMIQKGTPILYLNNTGGSQSGMLRFLQSGSTRWTVFKNGTAESGSNVGSDFSIRAYTDAGTDISSTPALFIKRSTMESTFGGSVITPASTTSAASFRIPHGTAPTSPVNGDIWSTTGGMFVRINGTTASIVDSNSTQTISNKTFEDSTTFAVRTGHRNVIINGDMSAVQRGTAAVTADAGYPVDRWFIKRSTSTVSAVRTTMTLGQYPGAPQHFLELTVTGSGGAGDYVRLGQQIENVQTFAGQTVTISFWGKASTAGTKLGIEFEQFFGTGGSPSSRVTGTGQTVTLTTTWTRYQVTFSIPSISGKTLGTALDSYLQLNLWMTAGSTYNARSGSVGSQTKNFSLTDIQVEEGSVATPFERIPSQANLSACQRYYWQWGPGLTAGATVAFGAIWAVNTATCAVTFPTPMRVPPTITFSAAGHFRLLAAGGSAATTFATPSIATTTGAKLDFTCGIGMGVGQGCWVDNLTNAAAAAMFVNAEFTPA